MDQSNSSASDQSTCDAKALDWALFIFTIIGTHVTWWLFSLPTLFKAGLRNYVHDIAWECLRLQVPSFIAFKSYDGQDRAHWQMNYYSGIKKPPTRFADIKAFVKDSVIVVSTGLALHRLTTGGKADKDISGLNVSLWMYPSLPVAIIGLSIAIFSKTQLKTWIIVVLTLGAIIAIAAGIAVLIALTYGHGIWYPSTLLMLFMGLPLWAISPKLLLPSAALSTIARIGGPIIGATSPHA